MMERVNAWLREDPFRLPRAFFIGASWLLLLSLLFPYWRMTLQAPQYPGGLRVDVYVTHLAGDVSEVDNLNHYIGMKKLHEAAQVERFLAPLAIGAAALLGEALAFTRRRWAAVLALPAMLFPFIFLARTPRCGCRPSRRRCWAPASWASSAPWRSSSSGSGWPSRPPS
jgi:hypothetical protein